MIIKNGLKIFMGFTAFSIWSGMVYFDASLRADYLKFIVSIVVGLGALALRDMPPAATKPIEETK